MKKVIALIVGISILLTACKKENKLGVLVTSVVTVNVKYPSNYAQESANSASVTITNTVDGTNQTTTTGSNGEALFKEVLPGTYSMTANKVLAAAEAQTLTGIGAAITLNAALNSATVVGGQNATFSLQLQGSAVGNLVIKEVYYTGSPTSTGGTYFSDQFVEIYNNSTETVFLDSLCIADIHGTAGLINATSLPTPFNTDANNVYASSIWRIPGTGKQRALAPGKSIVIAQDGVNHQDPTLNPNSPVNLSDADWETYNERTDNRDADAPNVPNLERVYFTGGFDWLIPVFGPSLVIFKADFASLEQVPIPGASATTPPRIKIPNGRIIDCVEFLKDGSSASFKRVPVALDAGFSFADGTYNKQSLRRKTAATIGGRRVLQDNNNTTSDFERIATPTPKGF